MLITFNFNYLLVFKKNNQYKYEKINFTYRKFK